MKGLVVFFVALISCSYGYEGDSQAVFMIVGENISPAVGDRFYSLLSPYNVSKLSESAPAPTSGIVLSFGNSSWSQKIITASDFAQVGPEGILGI